MLHALLHVLFNKQTTTKVVSQKQKCTKTINLPPKKVHERQAARMRTRSEWFLNGSRPRVLSSLEIQSCNEEDCTCPMTIGSTMDFDMHIHTNPDLDDENMDLDIQMLTGQHQDPTTTASTTTKSCFLTVPGQQPQQRHHHHHHHHPILLDSKYSLLSGSYDNLNNHHKNCIIHNNLYSSSISSLSLSSCSSSCTNNNNHAGKAVGGVTVVDYGLTATSRHLNEQYRRDQHLRLRRIRNEQQQLRLQLDSSVAATTADDEESNRSNLSTVLLTVLDFLF